MSETQYEEIVADLKKDNFPVEKLVRTQQWVLISLFFQL